MSIEILVSTMKNDISLFEKMNIKSDALIANQADDFFSVSRNIDENSVRVITTDTRGLGRNRNICLLNAKGDVCLIADDDMIYHDDYVTTVEKAFCEIKDADIIIFEVDTPHEDSNWKIDKVIKKIHRFNFGSYGSVRIAFKRDSILKNNIWFSSYIGAGTDYNSGEDSLFLQDALKCGLKVYAYPQSIAMLDDSESCCFKGFNDKYYFDKGVVFSLLFPYLNRPVFLLYSIRWGRTHKKSSKAIYKLMVKGMKAYRAGYSYHTYSETKI